MFAPADRARLVVDRTGALAAVYERGRITVVEVGGDAIAAIACDELARAVEIGWVGEHLFVLTQQRDHALVQRFAPRTGSLVDELGLDLRVRLGGIVADAAALVLGVHGAGLVLGEPLVALELAIDEDPSAVATAADGFLLGGGVIIEQWAAVPWPARLRAMRCPTELAFIGGTADAVWAIGRADARLFEVARWAGGDAPWLDLPEPIRWAAGDPYAPVVVCGGAEHTYVVRWDAELRADVLATRLDAAAIVRADPLRLLGVRGRDPLALLGEADLRPLDAPTGATVRSPRSEWRDELRSMAPLAPHLGATPGRWGVADEQARYFRAW